MSAPIPIPLFGGDASGIGRAALRGAVVGALVVGGVVGAIVLYAGAGLMDALAIAAFAAVFGGPGFGAMLGAVIFVDRRNHTAAPAVSTVSTVSTMSTVATVSKGALAHEGDEEVALVGADRYDFSSRVSSTSSR